MAQIVLFLVLIVPTLSVKDVSITNIEVVAGEPVYLPCDISTSNPKDQVALVLWYKQDLGTPIYSVDGRDRDFSLAERWSDENVFANRAYFMPEKQPAELGVDHIRESDQGMYRCRVDFRIAQTKNSNVNLTVVVPPQKVVITNESGAQLTSVVGPFSEGASFTLRCDVFGAKPLPTVTWFRNDVAVSNISVALPSAGTTHVRSELRISGLGRRDVHSELTCLASNNPKTAPLASTLHVDMNFGPLDVRILGANQPLSAGRRYDLLCQSTGSRPPASITWWKGAQRLEKAKKTTSSNGNTTTSTLSFVPKKEDDGKYLTCKAENKIVSNEELEDKWKLEIHYIPEAKILLGASLNPDAIREGTDVYFDCIVNAHPIVYKVEWRHNGRPLSINIQGGIIVSNQSLVLQGVSRSTAGNYTCVGYNTEGDGESKPFFLNVLYTPTCKPNQTRIYGVAKQEQAQIACHVDANPPDVQFRWTFNNSADSVDVAQSHIARTGTSSLVSYTPMTELDYGTLLCYATNRIGIQRVPCVYHIIAAGRPDQVHNCTIFNTSMTSFSIRCSEGFNGGLPQAFHIEIREVHTQELKHNLSSPIPRFSIINLEPGAQYQAALFSFNAKGRSEPVIVQAATLRLPEKQLTAEKDFQLTAFRVTPLMSVLIGVISALLIVALVIILVVRFQCAHNDDRNKRHKTGVINANMEHRGSIIGSTLNEKGGGSPVSKHESSGGECDSDEKNPDIIPQPPDIDESTDFLRRRQLISTIETSPNSSMAAHQINHANSNGGGYVRYCTLRSGMPIHDIVTQPKLHSPPAQIMGAGYGAYTLPRQQQWPYGPIGHLPTGMYQVPYPGPTQPQRSRLQSRDHAIPLQPFTTSEEEATVETPLMVNKRESTV